MDELRLKMLKRENNQGFGSIIARKPYAKKLGFNRFDDQKREISLFFSKQLFRLCVDKIKKGRIR